MSLVDGDHTTGGYNALNTKYIISALTKVAVCVLYVLQTTYAMYAESAFNPKDMMVLKSIKVTMRLFARK